MTDSALRKAAREHELKTDAAVFDAVARGLKTYELRKNDRGFCVGDTLVLRETRFTGAEMAAGAPLEYTGRAHTATVTHMLTGPIYGLDAGWSILSLSAPTPEPSEAVTQEQVEAWRLQAIRAAQAARDRDGEGVFWDVYATTLAELAHAAGRAGADKLVRKVRNAAYEQAFRCQVQYNEALPGHGLPFTHVEVVNAIDRAMEELGK